MVVKDQSMSQRYGYCIWYNMYVMFLKNKVDILSHPFSPHILLALLRESLVPCALDSLGPLGVRMRSVCVSWCYFNVIEIGMAS